MVSPICLSQLPMCGFCHARRHNRELTLAGTDLLWTSCDKPTCGLAFAALESKYGPLMAQAETWIDRSCQVLRSSGVLEVTWKALEVVWKESDESLRMHVQYNNTNKFPTVKLFLDWQTLTSED